MKDERGSNGHNQNARGNTAQQRMKEERIKRDQVRTEKFTGADPEPEKPNKREK